MKTKIITALVLVCLASTAVWAKSAAKTLEGTVNINSASVQELSLLPGIGPKTAEAIIAARPFQSTQDLVRVKGIGPKRLEKMAAYLSVSGPTTAKLVSASEKTLSQR